MTEWIELINGATRGVGGGSWSNSSTNLRSTTNLNLDAAVELNSVGFRVVRLAAPNPTFASFAAAAGVPADISDSDNDGLNNLLEYVFGSAPNDAVLRNLPVVGTSLVTVGANALESYLTLTIIHRLGATDVSFGVEASTNLSVWKTDTVLQSSTANGDGTETLTYRASISVAARPAQFLRVRATLLP